ncbi:MAG TPA: S8 family serine peptidase [Thermoanaerobaculia bacterium]|nr:S8 family serine peptidase [Thermoanaerobaculia bacterium]
MRRSSGLLAFLILAFPLFAERIRVVVAYDDAQIALAEVPDGTRWGDSAVFSVEIERDQLERLRRNPRVRAVDLDEGGHGGLAQSIPIVGADVLRARGIDGRGRTIAVLDTGIDSDHPDFGGRIIAEQCFCNNFDGTGCCPGGAIERSGAGSAEDDHGHGTHVAGIAAGNGPAPGVAPAAWIVAVKVMDAQNRFRGFQQIHDALQWIADTRPDVDAINMSLGSFARYEPSQCNGNAVAIGLQPVIARLRARGVLIAACSGNDGDTKGMWLPACMDAVVSVGATYDVAGSYGPADTVVPFTNSSAGLDLLAPGADITSSRRGGGWVSFSGTSMATPHVAGTILLIRQIMGHATADAVQELMQRTGKPVVDKRNGLTIPRLDALAAVDAAPREPVPPRRRTARH